MEIPDNVTGMPMEEVVIGADYRSQVRTNMNYPSNIESHFQRYRKAAIKRAEERAEELYNLLGLCDSPAEQLFLLAFMEGAPDKFDPIFSVPEEMRCIEMHFDYTPEMSILEVSLYLQRELDVPLNQYGDETKRYRADFLFEVRHKGLRLSACPLMELVVEVDGHDYHERTKEQAQRDRERDRLLTSEGLYAFRYTASEVFHSSEKVALEVLSFLHARASEIVSRQGLYIDPAASPNA